MRTAVNILQILIVIMVILAPSTRHKQTYVGYQFKVVHKHKHKNKYSRLVRRSLWKAVFFFF